MKKFAISGFLVGLSMLTTLSHANPSSEDLIFRGGDSETYHRGTVNEHHVPGNVVVIPGDKKNGKDGRNNPFTDPDYFVAKESLSNQFIHYRTKNLDLKVAEDGVTINGDFHKWRRKNDSWGIFDRAREADISVSSRSKVTFQIKVDWQRPIWRSAGQDNLLIEKNQVRMSEEVSKSLLNLGNDFESGVIKLDSAEKINSLVSVVNPYLAKPYTKRLVIKDNLSAKERVIETIITQAEALHGATAENEFLRQKFIENYWIGFSADDLIKIAEAAHGASAENEILEIGARAYLYYYSEEDIRKVAEAAHGASAENEILMLLAKKGAGSGRGPVVSVEGYTEADLERSRFISELISAANRSSSKDSSDRILTAGFEQNLHRNFSVTDIKRIARNINSSSTKDRLILRAASYYKHRWTQAEFKMLADATSYTASSDQITALAASQIGKPRRSGAFYDSQLGNAPKHGKFKLEVEWSKDD
tara:strand:- start:725 stop:2152 length:1428 start_codon:yes stop_codon:yes gene_type:complete